MLEVGPMRSGAQSAPELHIVIHSIVVPFTVLILRIFNMVTQRQRRNTPSKRSTNSLPPSAIITS